MAGEAGAVAPRWLSGLGRAEAASRPTADGHGNSESACPTFVGHALLNEVVVPQFSIGCRASLEALFHSFLLSSVNFGAWLI